MSTSPRFVLQSEKRRSPDEGRTLKQGLIQAALGLILLAGSSVLLHLLDGQRTAVARAEQLAYLPKGEYLKLAVLGYRQVVADLIWLQAVQHIGAKRDTQLGYTWTYHAVDVLTDLDPTFVPPYQATGLFLGVLVGRQEEGIGDPSARVRCTTLKLATAVSWPDMSPITSCAIRLQAREYLRIAARVPGSPAYLPQIGRAHDGGER
jgi:hypothetical protein